MPDSRVFALAASRSDFEPMRARLETRTGARFLLVRPPGLTPGFLSENKVGRVFLPHWSHLIPAAVYESVECVVFHMTDLPFGRGGSPLQNLIARGLTETMISALRCVKELDAGPVFLKMPLSLEGTAEEIFSRAYDVIETMIVTLVEQDPPAVPQEGNVTIFRRRKPADGSLEGCGTARQVYDWIRMLDAAGYPNAFLEAGGLRLEFRKASLSEDCVTAEVRIRLVRPASKEEPSHG